MKTLTIKTILASIVLPAMLTACYKEDPLHSERGEIPYKIEDSDNPALHYIYEYNQKTGVYILSDYTDVDFKWNVGSESNNDLIRIKDGVLDEAIEYVKAVLTEVYPEEFAKKCFPLKVLLADSISVSTSKSDDLLVGSGRSYIAIGRLHKGDIPTDEDKLADIRGEVSGYLWGNYIYSNNLMTIPEGFSFLLVKSITESLSSRMNTSNMKMIRTIRERSVSGVMTLTEFILVFALRRSWISRISSRRS